MTCIAYRDGVLACDSAWTNSDGVAYRQTKIHRLPSGALCGFAGSGDGRAIMRLVGKVTRTADMPSRAALAEIPDDLEMLLILPNSQLFLIVPGKESAEVERINRPKFASIGSGATLAFGAMLAGASARTAVKHAANYADGCRAPIYTLKLKQARK